MGGSTQLGEWRRRVVARPTNQELLSRCAGGDHEAWDTIVGKYERLVYSIAIREGLDDHDAADVTQEVFAALLSSLTAIDNPERLGSWLMTVARRTTWRRRASRRATREFDEEFQVAEDPNDDLVRATWLYEAVDALGEPCSSIIVALFLDPDEPSYEEIALRLGRPIGSLGPTRSRCLDRLRRYLEEETA